MGNRILVFTKYELLKIMRQPITVFFAIIFPILMITFYGEVYGNEPSKLFGNIGTLDFIFPTTAFLIILVNGLSNLPLVISSNINSKVLKTYAFTKLKKIEYLTSIFLSNFLLVLLSSLVLFFYAYVRYDITVSQNIILFYVVVLVFSASVSFLGVTIASVIKQFQSVISVSFLFYFTILFTSGASIPLAVLPNKMEELFVFSPFTKMAIILQNVWLSKTTSLLEIILIFIFSLFLIVLGVVSFKWD